MCEASGRAGSCLAVRTLGGKECVLDGLSPHTSILEVKKQLGQLLSAPPFTLKLVMGQNTLSANATTLQEAGLTDAGANVVLIRCAGGNEDEWRSLRDELLRVVQLRRTDEAKRLIDMGAGLDGNGNLLRVTPQGRLTTDAEAQGCTLLHLAIRERLMDLVLYVLSLGGADLDAKNDCGRAPLLQALVMRQRLVAEALLDAGASPYVPGASITTLEHALRDESAGGDALVARLIPHYPPDDVEAAFTRVIMDDDHVCPPSRKYTKSPVLVACANQMPLTALALLEAGHSAAGKDWMGRTPLHFACGYQMREVEQRLLQSGADRFAQDSAGASPGLALSSAAMFACVGVPDIPETRRPCILAQCAARVLHLWSKNDAPDFKALAARVAY